LGHFLEYCEAQVIDRISQITANNKREYLLWLEETGHNPGGLHAAYRTLKTFLRWYDLEVEPEGWCNPITKVKAPKISEEPLEPVEVKDVFAMSDACNTTFMGKRDRAILLFLLDSGVRARELLAIKLKDVNLVNGSVLVRMGKGHKPRSVFIGRDTLKALRSYLNKRTDELEGLWVTDDTKSMLTYGGLRAILRRRARHAGVEIPTAHDFRRAFAVNMLRKGADLITLARLMGHTGLKVLQRYLHQLPEDLQATHQLAGPVDHHTGK
jgi:integrase/recombinase XerD